MAEWLDGTGGTPTSPQVSVHFNPLVMGPGDTLSDPPWNCIWGGMGVWQGIKCKVPVKLMVQIISMRTQVPHTLPHFDQRNIRDWQAHPMKRLPVKQHI